ncbi:MAG: hypothetical protein HY840_01495 [Bacteroidetes bacterium]|nr:hypothetical protein [Bacteroidota bacterium]
MVRIVFHYAMHLLAPGLIAKIAFKNNWKKAWLIMLLTLLADIDHLFASPFFDLNRCSIGYHPLHSYIAIVIYAVLLFVPRLRIVSVGLLFHMLTDFIDCLWISAQ